MPFLLVMPSGSVAMTPRRATPLGRDATSRRTADFSDLRRLSQCTFSRADVVSRNETLWHSDSEPAE